MTTKVKKAAVVLSSLLAFTCLAGCGGNGDTPDGDQERITFWGITDQYTSESYKQLVDAYNEGQGKIDGVFVKYSPKTDSSANHISYCGSARGTVDIIGVSDRYVFNNIAQGFYTNLQDYIDDETTYTRNEAGEAYFSEDNYSANNIDRFRFNAETREAGAGEDLYALPLVSNASVIYYNEDYFLNNNINIISVTEEELDAYNAANGTDYAARGYAEYTAEAAPAKGLKTSENLQGETVVKVFNDLIPMSFLEVNTLSKYFSTEYNAASPSRYGILNEWWFSHGWAVGGDCVKWDEASGQYKFTLGDKQPNYLVTSAVTVNGTAYAAGDILTYRDRNYVLETALRTSALIFTNFPPNTSSSASSAPGRRKQTRKWTTKCMVMRSLPRPQRSITAPKSTISPRAKLPCSWTAPPRWIPSTTHLSARRHGISPPCTLTANLKGRTPQATVR